MSIKNIKSFAFVVAAIIAVIPVTAAHAQYDYSSYPSFDYGSSGTDYSSYPSYDYGSTGTDYSSYPSYDTGSSYDYSSYPSYDYGSSGTTDYSSYPSYDYGNTASNYSSYPSYDYGSSGTNYSSYPSYDYSNTSAYPSTDCASCTNTSAYPTYTSAYPTDTSAYPSNTSAYPCASCETNTSAYPTYTSAYPSACSSCSTYAYGYIPSTPVVSPSYYSYNSYSTTPISVGQPIVINQQQQQQQQQSNNQPINIVNNNVNTNTNTNTNTTPSVTPVYQSPTQYNVQYVAPTTYYPQTYYPQYPQYPQYQNLYCSITASPSNVAAGQYSYLTWSSSGGVQYATLSGVGTVGPNGSWSVRPSGSQNYVLTVYAYNGQSASCNTYVTINSVQPYVTLSQIPYTGFDFGPIGDAMYWALLFAFAASAAYLAIYYKGGAFAFAGSMVKMPRFSMPKKAVKAAPAASASVAPMPVINNQPVVELPTHSSRYTVDSLAIDRSGSVPRLVVNRE